MHSSWKSFDEICYLVVTDVKIWKERNLFCLSDAVAIRKEFFYPILAPDGFVKLRNRFFWSPQKKSTDTIPATQFPLNNNDEI